MSGVFEGSIHANIGKKTRRMKWKVSLTRMNKTDASLKIDADTNGKKTEADLLIHLNKNKTVDINGYVLKDKKRKNVSAKNTKLTESELKEQITLLLV